MSTRTTATLAILLASIATRSIPAQDDLPRARLAGIARCADGSPWSGAVVHAREQGVNLLACREVDAVETTTDERGHFALAILDGRPYALWASQAASDGNTLCSAVALDLHAGDRPELVADATPRAVRKLKLVGPGIDPGRRLCIEVREREISSIQRLETTTGEVTLAPGPPIDGQLIVTDAKGRLVLCADLPADGATHLVHASGPRCMRVRVAERGKNQPIAGATVGTVLDGTWFPIGDTGADGTTVADASFGFATLDDGEQTDDDSMGQLYVKAPGHHLGLLTAPALPLRSQSEVGDQIDVTCHPQGLEVRQCIATFAADGHPLAGVCLGATASAWECQDDEMFGTEVELEFQSGADGRIDLTGLRNGDETLELWISAPVLRVLPADWRKGMAESIPLFLDPDQAAQSFALDLVRDLRVVDFEFLAAGDGAPATGAQIVLAGADDHVGTLCRSDRTGRLRTMLPVKSKARICVGLCDERGWCAVELDPTALGKDRERALLIRPPLAPSLRVKITTKTPDDFVAGSDLSISGYFNGGSEPPATAVQRNTDATSAPFTALDPASARQFSQHFILRAGAVGSGGREWVMHIPSIEGVFEVSASALSHDALYTATARIPTSASEAEIRVELELERQ